MATVYMLFISSCLLQWSVVYCPNCLLTYKPPSCPTVLLSLVPLKILQLACIRLHLYTWSKLKLDPSGEQWAILIHCHID